MFIICLIDSDSKFSHVNFKLSYTRSAELSLNHVTFGLESTLVLSLWMFEQVTLFLFMVQVLKLQNTGALPVHYEVDTDVLLKLQMDNFNHAVLTCLNPEGDVPAGQSAMVEWIFSPLEAKLYSVRLIPTVIRL